MKRSIRKSLAVLLTLILACSAVFAAGVREKAEFATTALITDITVDKDGIYSFTTVTENNEEVIFHAAAIHTYTNLDLSMYRVGDYVEFQDTGISTMSLPPQRNAVEMRLVTPLVNMGLIEVDIDPKKAEKLPGVYTPQTIEEKLSYAFGYYNADDFSASNVFVNCDYYLKGISDSLTFDESALDMSIDEISGAVPYYEQNYYSKGEGISEFTNADFFPMTVEELPAVDNDFDRFSYAYGFIIAYNLYAEGLDLEYHPYAEGFLDRANERACALSTEQIDAALLEFQEQQYRAYEEYVSEMSKANLEKAENFLDQNRFVEGVTTTESGLQYKVLKEPTGEGFPGPDSTVQCYYELRNYDGMVLESSIQADQVVEFPVSGVIKGFGEMLQLMQPGEKVTIWVHPDLAYGEFGTQTIEPNALLQFDIELVSFN